MSADDSLLDVEQHIAEIESYLASGGAGVTPSPSPPAASAYAAHEQNMRQYEMARNRGAQSSKPASSAPSYPISAASHSSTPRDPYSLNSSISSASSASLRSTPAAAAASSSGRRAADFDSFGAHSHQQQRHDLNASVASGFSTPSTISSASGMGSARYDDAAPPSMHDYDDEPQQLRSARSGRSAQSTPHTERSAVVAPALASEDTQSSAATAVAAANAAEKQRIVAQLLAQHRQAQVTGRAMVSRVSPASASLASAAATVAPAQVSSIVVPPAQMHKAERDQMVERLLQQRRKQKEAEEAAAAANAAAAVPSQQPRQQSQPPAKSYSYDAPIYERPANPTPNTAMSRAPVAPPQPAVPAASRFQSKPQSQRHAPPPPLPPLPPPSVDDDESFHDADDSNADASSVLSSSGLLPRSPSGQMDGESFHSTHSSIARSRSGDSDAHSDSGSSVSSPDPRFHGQQQTIFDASEWINEDGTSIIHDSSATAASYPEQVREEADDDDRHDESARHTEDDERTEEEEERSAELDQEQKHSAVAIMRKPAAASRDPQKPFSPSTAQRFGKDAAAQPPQSKQQQQPRKAAIATHLNQRARRTKSKSRSPVRAATGSTATAPKRSSSLVRRPVTAAPRPTAASQAHAAANASRYSRASVEAEIERERAEMCTFTPTFVSRPLLDATGSSMQERLDVWQRRQAAALHRKLEQKREYEEEKLQECTFAPAINPTSAHVASRSVARNQEPVAERLHHEADQRAILRERAKRLSEEEMLAGLPFAPQLSTTSRKVVERAQAKAAASAADGTAAANAAKPLYQRVAELQKRKNERLHAALLASRAAAGADSDFKPSINPVSEKLAKEREEKERQARRGAWEEVQRAQDAIDDPAGSSGPAAVSARLAGAGSNALVTQRLRQANQALEATMRAHTFKPEVNPVSEQLLKTSRVFAGPGGKDFLQRQQRLQALSRAAAAERAQAEASQAGLTFKPDIGNADQILQASKQRHAEAAAAAARAAGLDADLQLQQAPENETAEEAAARLSSQDARQLSLLKTKLRVLHEAQQGLTFTPEISAVSRKLAENRAALAAASAEAGEPHPDSAEARAAAAQLLAEHSASEFARNHPFAPRLNPASQEMIARGLVAPHYPSKDMTKLTSQIREDGLEKDQKLAAIARAAAIKELAECTFDPSAAAPLGRLPKIAKEPVLVRGMNRFLELKALRKRMEEEQAARERKVFMLDIYEPSAATKSGVAAAGAAASSSAGEIDRGTEEAHRLGYTVPHPFHLSHAARSKERSAAQERAHRDAHDRAMQECSWAPVTNAAHNRQILQHVLQEDDEPVP